MKSLTQWAARCTSPACASSALIEGMRRNSASSSNHSMRKEAIPRGRQAGRPGVASERWMSCRFAARTPSGRRRSPRSASICSRAASHSRSSRSASAPPTVRAPRASSPGSARTCRTRCRPPPAYDAGRAGSRRQFSQTSSAAADYASPGGAWLSACSQMSTSTCVMPRSKTRCRPCVCSPFSGMPTCTSRRASTPTSAASRSSGIAVTGAGTPRLRMHRRSACVCSDCSRRSTCWRVPPKAARHLSGDHQARQSGDPRASARAGLS